MKEPLTPGDVILFKAEDDWFSKAICWFTQSDVSHAAMVYSNDSIVEVGAYGIGVHTVETNNGKGVYVKRLSPAKDPAPLLQAADAYLTAEIRYDFPALFLLAGLLIYRRIVPSSRLFDITSRILAAACLKLDEMIQHAILHNPDRAMVCSQLVYQIFYDCGEDYRIEIVDGCVWNSISAPKVSHSIRLFDLLAENEENVPSATLCETLNSQEIFTDEARDEFAKELYLALCESEKMEMENALLQKEKLSSVLSIAEGFLSRMKHFLELIKCDIPLDAMFVTPGDLMDHAPNLELVKTLALERVKNYT